MKNTTWNKIVQKYSVLTVCSLESRPTRQNLAHISDSELSTYINNVFQRNTTAFIHGALISNINNYCNKNQLYLNLNDWLSQNFLGCPGLCSLHHKPHFCHTMLCCVTQVMHARETMAHVKTLYYYDYSAGWTNL